MLVQIPGFVMAAWLSAKELEVYYDDSKQEIIIKPAAPERGNPTKERYWLPSILHSY